MSEWIEVVRDGAVMTIRMNRPDKKNAITRAMYAAMASAPLRAQLLSPTPKRGQDSF